MMRYAILLCLCFISCKCLPIEQKDYNFNYSVDDQETGDHKSHHESLEGGVVKGYYSLKEADGTFREVHYTADKQHGFTALVKNTGTPTIQDKYNMDRDIYNQPIICHHYGPIRPIQHKQY